MQLFGLAATEKTPDPGKLLLFFMACMLKQVIIKAQRMQTADKLSMFNKQLSNGDIEMHVQKMTSGRELLGLPTIIYASRYHFVFC